MGFIVVQVEAGDDVEIWMQITGGQRGAFIYKMAIDDDSTASWNTVTS
jgi:hypothetical protein